jgi:4'-phosphopantetheinyl transferase
MDLTNDDRPRDAAVHVWRVDLSRLELPELWKLLTDDERARAERFHFARDRDRYVGARGALRVLLASHGSSRPEQLRFVYSPQGKPALAGEAPALRFNLAHSDDLAVIAIAEGRDVGVDVEREPSDEVVTEVGPRVLCERERESLARLDGASRRRAFARLWTRKEACIKADGGGFALPLDRIDVSGRSRRVLELDQAGRWVPSPRWTVYGVRVRTGYAGALAVSHEPVRLILGHWPGNSRGSRGQAPGEL